MYFSNLVVIFPNENWPASTHRSPHKVNKSVPVYTGDQLHNMPSKLKQIRYCILPFETIEIIWKYKINKHPRKLDLNRKIPQTEVNTRNLVQVKLSRETCRNKSNNIRLATINVRSIKNKVEQIFETSSLENTDFTILKEIWLKDTDEDRAWIATSRLDNNEYQLQTIKRSTRQGKRAALLHKGEYQTTRIENSPLFDTTEYGSWATTVRNRKLLY